MGLKVLEFRGLRVFRVQVSGFRLRFFRVQGFWA